MASRWTEVERVEQGALPTMLAQAVIVGTALTVGAIACSGFYLNMIADPKTGGPVVALVPWMVVTVFIAVVFSYVVGFALLWCAESFTNRMKDTFKPWAYAVVGLIGYAIWGMFVMGTTMNSLDQAVNGVVLANQDILAVTANYAVFGFIAFLLAQAYGAKLATRKTAVIVLLVVQIVLAVLGGIVLFMIFGQIPSTK
ncbi:cadmium transporter [Bifidobacterium callitrichidarum]|uniref:Cadmium transporter n=1 Tax=Bifidobacterium callitrichidarum TaxID=2052941 RepID=A0A2U2N875_9BIFI|nr:cadmium transporter [Bifidobacterium callitrichidarum]PWG65308.1 cadmium transporter [Bifidobacterium callitrichidarum]